MSWFSTAMARRCLLVALAMSLAGCGFRPLYVPRAPQDWDPELAAISVSPIRDRSGQILELALRENLNPGGASVPARWRLDTGVTVSRADLGLQRNATATSSEVTVNANFTMTDLSTGKVVYASGSRAIGDFDRLNDAYATQVAADDAQERALREVADEMALRIALFVRRQHANAANP